MTEASRSVQTPAPTPTLPPATAIEDVTIRPIPPKPSLFIEPVDEQHPPSVPHEPPAQAFIPPQPERPARPPRMPRIEDLPAQAQKELRASRGEEVEATHPVRRTSLLQRLASVGLGRREEPEEPAAPAPRPAPRQAERAPAPPVQRAEAPRQPDPRAQESRAQDPRAQDPRTQDPRAQDPRAHESPMHESRAPDPVSEYAKRPAGPRQPPQGLDPHGRPTPVLNAFDDDQLEIPAFLRRQAN